MHVVDLEQRQLRMGASAVMGVFAAGQTMTIRAYHHIVVTVWTFGISDGFRYAVSVGVLVVVHLFSLILFRLGSIDHCRRCSFQQGCWAEQTLMFLERLLR